MAWLYGNKRWTSQFYSLGGTHCHIDIYQREYTGSFVQEVLAASNPFFYEEGNDSDLLNEVLRYRTGYIRMVDEYDGTVSLSGIYPQSAFERYVEVYYGTELIFTGYIQVQDFSNEMKPLPRVVELPVVSPVGLMDQLTISNTAYLPPVPVTLGTLLDEIMKYKYDYVYVPYNYGYPNTIDLGMKVSSLFASPWNEDFHHSMNVEPASKVMKGESYAYVIESICKAFGWICHDTAGALVFTAFDFEGQYCRYPVGHIGDSNYMEDAGIPYAESPLSDYFSLADDSANETTLMPDTGIKITYEGESDSQTFTFARTYVPTTNPVIVQPGFDPTQYPNHAETYCLCNLIPVYLAKETSVTGEFAFDSNGKLVIGNHCVAWHGNEGVMCSMGSYNTGRVLFYVRFYMKKKRLQVFNCTYDVVGRRDGQIGGLVSNGDVDKNYISYSMDVSHDDYIQVNFAYNWNAERPQLPTQALIFIHNIHLNVYVYNKPYIEYTELNTGDSDTIPSSGDPVISSELTMPISVYRRNDRLIGDTVHSTKLTEYPYLFQPRKELTGTFEIVILPSYPHIRLFSFLNKKWRIIAQRFDPWNDKIRLTMQSSAVL